MSDDERRNSLDCGVKVRDDHDGGKGGFWNNEVAASLRWPHPLEMDGKRLNKKNVDRKRHMEAIRIIHVKPLTATLLGES